MDFKEILKNLYGMTEPDSLSSKDIDFLENKYGNIPSVIKEFYMYCGGCIDNFISQDIWILPKEYKKYPKLNETEHLLLLNENQSVCLAAVLEKRRVFRKSPCLCYLRFQRDMGTLCRFGKGIYLCRPCI